MQRTSKITPAVPLRPRRGRAVMFSVIFKRKDDRVGCQSSPVSPTALIWTNDGSLEMSHWVKDHDIILTYGAAREGHRRS